MCTCVVFSEMWYFAADLLQEESAILGQDINLGPCVGKKKVLRRRRNTTDRPQSTKHPSEIRTQPEHGSSSPVKTHLQKVKGNVCACVFVCVCVCVCMCVCVCVCVCVSRPNIQLHTWGPNLYIHTHKCKHILTYTFTNNDILLTNSSLSSSSSSSHKFKISTIMN